MLRVELLLLLLLVLGDEPAPLDLAFSRVVLLLIGRSVQPMIAAVDERAVRAAELRRHAAAGEAAVGGGVLPALGRAREQRACPAHF